MGSTEWVDIASTEAAADDSGRHPFLEALGERVRTLRSRKGMTRRAVALAAVLSGKIDAKGKAIGVIASGVGLGVGGDLPRLGQARWSQRRSLRRRARDTAPGFRAQG